MAEIGHFGSSLVFSTSDRKVLNFNGFTQQISGTWSNHTLIGKKAKKEFNGPGLRKVTFKMTLNAVYGVKPRKLMETMENLVENGIVEYLVIGGKSIGSNRFVMTDISETWDVIYNGGEVAMATVSVTMEEYV